MQSRIDYLLGQYLEAERAAQQALALAKTTSEILEARSALALAIHDQSMQMIRADKAPDDALLREGREALRAVLAIEPGHPRAADLLLGIALLLGDGPTAQFAWRQYFRLPAERPGRGDPRSAWRHIGAHTPTFACAAHEPRAAYLPHRCPCSVPVL